MTPARWYITQHAVERYMHARRWPDDDDHFGRAEDELLEQCQHATFRERDSQGRELWRSSRAHGGWRWIVDPRPHPGGKLPRCVWVGQSAPPESLWVAQDSLTAAGQAAKDALGPAAPGLSAREWNAIADAVLRAASDG